MISAKHGAVASKIIMFIALQLRHPTRMTHCSGFRVTAMISPSDKGSKQDCRMSGMNDGVDMYWSNNTIRRGYRCEIGAKVRRVQCDEYHMSITPLRTSIQSIS